MRKNKIDQLADKEITDGNTNTVKVEDTGFDNEPSFHVVEPVEPPQPKRRKRRTKEEIERDRAMENGGELPTETKEVEQLIDGKSLIDLLDMANSRFMSLAGGFIAEKTNKDSAMFANHSVFSMSDKEKESLKGIAEKAAKQVSLNADSNPMGFLIGSMVAIGLIKVAAIIEQLPKKTSKK